MNGDVSIPADHVRSAFEIHCLHVCTFTPFHARIRNVYVQHFVSCRLAACWTSSSLAYIAQVKQDMILLD